MYIKINNIKIKNPTGFNEEFYDITKGNRLADGSMSLELIARKRKYVLSYKAMSATEFNELLKLTQSSGIFFKVEMNIDNVPRVLTMYKGALKRSRHMSFDGSEWIWKNISVNFIEK